MNRRLLLALAPAALALATLAQAQPPGPPPGPGGGPMAHMMNGAPEMKAMHEAMMQRRVEDLKTVLRLRPDQEPALQAFMAAHHKPGIGEMHGMAEMHAAPAAQTTPERLAAMAKHEAAMTAEHETQRQALARFYAALSPDQQKVFDALQRLQGPHMGGGHMAGGPREVRRIEIRREGPGRAPDHERH